MAQAIDRVKTIGQLPFGKKNNRRRLQGEEEKKKKNKSPVDFSLVTIGVVGGGAPGDPITVPCVVDRVCGKAAANDKRTHR